MSLNKNWMVDDNVCEFDEARAKYSRLKEHTDAMQAAFVPARHHIWCNFWSTPISTCKQCKGLYRDYPMGNMSEDDLQKKYFPSVIKVSR